VRQPGRDERHDDDGDERQERQQHPHLAEAEFVVRLDLHDQDHPDAPVLPERPVPRQQGGDATTLGVDNRCRLQGRLLHGAT
jgi:hypothetical protein